MSTACPTASGLYEQALDRNAVDRRGQQSPPQGRGTDFFPAGAGGARTHDDPLTSTGEAAGHQSVSAQSLGRAAGELLLLGSVLIGYRAARLITANEHHRARVDARTLLRVEHWLGFPHEQALQHAVMHVPTLVRLANCYYAGVHFPATALALVALFLFDRHRYLRARTALVASTVLGLALHLTIPTAPPRMLHSAGFLDTGALIGPAVYSDTGQGMVNQYAALPSLHVGWAVIVGWCWLGSRHRWVRSLGVIHPAITVAVVVVTGNHYWLDCLVGVAAAVVGLAVAPMLRSRSAPRLNGPRGGPMTSIDHGLTGGSPRVRSLRAGQGRRRRAVPSLTPNVTNQLATAHLPTPRSRSWPRRYR